jgi:cytochrome c oxidase cbb3-type subunit 4
MDMGSLRGLVTLVLMLLFVALVMWAYSRRRSDDFAAASQLPLVDDNERAPGSERRS